MRIIGAVIIGFLIADPVAGFSVPQPLAATSSCQGRCDQMGTDSGASCQCNEHCVRYEDCCADYGTLCGSCFGRCDDVMDSSSSCQCNSKCLQFGDCCSDYDGLCSDDDEDSTPAGYLSDADLKAATSAMWDLDTYRFQDNQFRTSINPSGGTLFDWVDESLLLRGSWPMFINLLDNYIPQTGITEPSCPQCRQDEENFLNAILGGNVMRKVWEVLSKAGLASKNLNEFKSELKQYWFLPYSRAQNKLDSSGFEHVFVGEIKSGAVSGFHNWLQFYLEERDGELEYDRHINSCQPNTESVGMTWLNYPKSATTMLVGSTPEFEMGLYTICFLARRNQVCTASYGGRTRKVTTWTWNGSSKLTVGTAYPLC